MGRKSGSALLAGFCLIMTACGQMPAIDKSNIETSYSDWYEYLNIDSMDRLDVSEYKEQKDKSVNITVFPDEEHIKAYLDFALLAQKHNEFLSSYQGYFPEDMSFEFSFKQNQGHSIVDVLSSYGDSEQLGILENTELKFVKINPDQFPVSVIDEECEFNMPNVILTYDEKSYKLLGQEEGTECLKCCNGFKNVILSYPESVKPNIDSAINYISNFNDQAKIYTTNDDIIFFEMN